MYDCLSIDGTSYSPLFPAMIQQQEHNVSVIGFFPHRRSAYCSANHIVPNRFSVWRPLVRGRFTKRIWASLIAEMVKSICGVFFLVGVPPTYLPIG